MNTLFWLALIALLAAVVLVGRLLKAVDSGPGTLQQRGGKLVVLGLAAAALLVAAVVLAVAGLVA